MEAFGESENVDVVYHYNYIIDKEGVIIGMSPAPEIEDYCIFSEKPLKEYLTGRMPNSPSSSGISVRKRCLENFFPIPKEWSVAGDWNFRYILPLYAGEFRIIRKYLFYYRLHDSNLFVTKSPKDRYRTLLAAHKLFAETILRKHGERLKMDVSGIEKMFRTWVIKDEIMIYKFDGKILKALQKASAYPVEGKNRLLRSINKTKLFAEILLPCRFYDFLKRLYLKSPLFLLKKLSKKPSN
jgi:hypothetical protein